MSDLERLARAAGPHGETVLRRRGEIYELIVNGAFAMDSAHTATEAALATLALAALGAGGGRRIAVGGLGLGCTLAALLADGRVARVQVAELEPALPGWLAADLVPGTAALLADPRVTVTTGDVADLLPGMARRAGGFDAVLLDVDNGPGFLVHEHNAALYAGPFLAVALAALRPDGVLAIWSADPSPELLHRLLGLGARVEERRLAVERDGRRYDHAIYLAVRPAVDPASAPAAGQ